jgi:hypothetical protein
VCGNGVVDVPDETCDDNNPSDCGTCDSTCNAAGTGATCPDGTECLLDDDCQGLCVSLVCTS